MPSLFSCYCHNLLKLTWPKRCIHKKFPLPFLHLPLTSLLSILVLPTRVDRRTEKLCKVKSLRMHSGYSSYTKVITTSECFNLPNLTDRPTLSYEELYYIMKFMVDTILGLFSFRA